MSIIVYIAHTLNMCWRAFKSGRGMYIRLSKRRLIAYNNKLINQNSIIPLTQ